MIRCDLCGDSGISPCDDCFGDGMTGTGEVCDSCGGFGASECPACVEWYVGGQDDESDATDYGEPVL